MQDLNDIIKQLNAKVSKLDTFQGALNSLDNDILKVVLSSDLSYYHQIEIRFRDVSFILINTDFRIDTSVSFFSVLSEDELKLFSKIYKTEVGKKVFKIIDEDQCKFYVAASYMEVSYELKKYT